MWSRPKIYKGNQQAVMLIVENKNIQALMTNILFGHLVRVYCFSGTRILLHSDNLFLIAQINL
jgi:hypothetical protein